MAFNFLSKLAASGLGFLSGLIKQNNGAVFQHAKDGGKRVLSLCNAKSVSDITKFPLEVLKSDELLMELFEVWMFENRKMYKTDAEKLRRFEIFRRKVITIYIDNHIPFANRRLNKMADISGLEFSRIMRR